jgi:hypothetical protein
MNKELPNFDAILEFTDQSVGGGQRQIQIINILKILRGLFFVYHQLQNISNGGHFEVMKNKLNTDKINVDIY